MASDDKKKKYYRELEDLPGVGEATAERLRKAGYVDFVRLAAATPHELAEVAEMGVEAARKAIEASKETVEIGFETADVAYERRKLIGKIKTGSDSLDELFGGGIETQAITECYGKFSSGKSQVGFQLCVNVQKPLDKGGLNGKVLFIDTEATFRPDRIAQMAEAAGMNVDEVMKNIYVSRAENSDHQMLLIEKSDELIKSTGIRLVVMDSLTSHFRADYIGRGALSDRQQKLNKHIHDLQRLSEKHNVAIYITNQVMDNPGILFGDPTTPIGGHVLAHAATYRVYLRKSKEEKRIARMVDSPNLPEGECVFKVTKDGIRD